MRRDWKEITKGKRAALEHGVTAHACMRSKLAKHAKHAAASLQRHIETCIAKLMFSTMQMKPFDHLYGKCGCHRHVM